MVQLRYAKRLPNRCRQASTGQTNHYYHVNVSRSLATAKFTRVNARPLALPILPLATNLVQPTRVLELLFLRDLNVFQWHPSVGLHVAGQALRLLREAIGLCKTAATQALGLLRLHRVFASLRRSMSGGQRRLPYVLLLAVSLSSLCYVLQSRQVATLQTRFQ